MKKISKHQESEEYDMLPEYDFKVKTVFEANTPGIRHITSCREPWF